ncbi:hypothetical protein PI125_g20389 [Phytophthora idaei]|nr:hypothetical protein PI125_g20389 [Phytophthora idaei]
MEICSSCFVTSTAADSSYTNVERSVAAVSVGALCTKSPS